MELLILWMEKLMFHIFKMILGLKPSQNKKNDVNNWNIVHKMFISNLLPVFDKWHPLIGCLINALLCTLPLWILLCFFLVKSGIKLANNWDITFIASNWIYNILKNNFENNIVFNISQPSVTSRNSLDNTT